MRSLLPTNEALADLVTSEITKVYSELPKKKGSKLHECLSNFTGRPHCEASLEFLLFLANRLPAVCTNDEIKVSFLLSCLAVFSDSCFVT